MSQNPKQHLNHFPQLTHVPKTYRQADIQTQKSRYVRHL